MPLTREERALIGRHIREARVAAGLTQAQLGAALDSERGVTNKAVSGIESGDATISIGRLVRIARALDVTASSLLDGV